MAINMRENGLIINLMEEVLIILNIGKFIGIDGEKYEGDWKDNKKDGNGK